VVATIGHRPRRNDPLASSSAKATAWQVSCVGESVNNVAWMNSYTLEPVGFLRSTVQGRADAPRQGSEGAPDVWLEIEPRFAEALLGMEVGHELIVITFGSWGELRNISRSEGATKAC